MSNTAETQAIGPEKTMVTDEELIEVIAEFLEMGHVENIVAMFKQETSYYTWTGHLLNDERFAVRLGVSVLFEYLKEERPLDIHLAIPSLAEQLTSTIDWVRGEAVSILGIIGSKEALVYIRSMINDPSPQVTEIAYDILGLDSHE